MRKEILIYFLMLCCFYQGMAQETNPFMTKWIIIPDREDITIQLNPDFNYDFGYELKDASDSTIASGTHSSLAGDFTTVLSKSGIYTLSISGSFPHLYDYPKDQLVDVLSWGNVLWESFEGSFSEWPYDTFSATDVPNLTQVANMSHMFAGASSFNYDLSVWNVSSVTNMESLFDGVRFFNSDLSSWDVSEVTNMKNMFSGASSMIGDLSSWNVSSVTDMSSMFEGARNFNGDLSNWDVSNVTNMGEMFLSADDFNSDLSSWDVSNVTDMTRMFAAARNYDHDLSSWQIKEALSNDGVDDFLDFSGLSDENYDKLLASLASQEDLPQGVKFGAREIDYCLGAFARKELVNEYNWTITDGILSCEEFGFVTQWSTSFDLNEILIQLNPDFDYNFNYEWRDASGSTITSGTHTSLDGAFISVLPDSDSNPYYTLEVNGSFPHLFDYSKDQLITVLNWGDITWQSFESSFAEWPGESFSATDTPDLTQVTDMSGAFAEATNFTSRLKLYYWDVSNVTNMSSMFEGASLFNELLFDWNVRNVKDMSSIFKGCKSFNTSLRNWNVGNVTNMSSMFEGAESFQGAGHGIGSVVFDWDVKNVTDMSNMFKGASSFNQIITSWDVSDVTNMSSMFNGAAKFDNNIGSWDVSNVTDMSSMFEDATSLTRILSNWDVSSVTDMNSMFKGASSFNGNLTNWDVSRVTDMGSLFEGASSFNGNGNDLNDWDVSSVRNMSSLFEGASSFDQKISGWDVDRVTDMSDMFRDAQKFNRDISNWDVDRVTDMSGMFAGASDFNGNGDNLNNWNVSRVTNMSGMFDGATAFDRKIKAWNVSKVTDMSLMFRDASSFNRDLSNWSVGNVTTMSHMFTGAEKFNGNGNNLNNWNVSKVTDMGSMFRGAILFNRRIDNWNISNVTNMAQMFDGEGAVFSGQGHAFNKDLSDWDVGNVTNMKEMFKDAISFNQDISNWDVSKVTNMSGMFAGRSNGPFGDLRHTFNQDLSNWDVGSVTNMSQMFADAGFFNGDLSQWDVSSLTNMSFMFNHAERFNSDLSSWDVSNLKSGISKGAYEAFTSSNISRDNYGKLLIGWAALENLNTGVHLGAEDQRFCLGAEAREQLINEFGWIINDAGLHPSCDVTNQSARIGEDAGIDTDVEDERADELNLLIYPNPTLDILSIQSDESVKVYLKDLTGKVVISERSGTDLEMNLSSLRPGTYLLYVDNGSEIVVRRIINAK